MRRKKQDKHSDSYWVNHHPDCNRTLFHIIKYHPSLCHFFERLAYKRGGEEKSAAGTVPAFSTDRKKEVNHVTRNSNVEKKMTPNSSFAKDSLRSRIKAIVSKEIAKKRSRHHRSSASPQGTNNMNKNLLTTFVQDPVSPLAYHLHKQQVYGSKMKLTRCVSFPIPDSTSERPSFGAIGNGSLQKDKGKSCFDNKTESTNKFYVRSMSSGAKCFNVNEAKMVKDVNCSSGSSQGQNQNEIKQFKNLKQKIEHVTGESRKEKLRVTMDAFIHKIPQDHGISDDLKKEIFKKLTDPNFAREGEYYPECSSESDRSSPSFTKHHRHNIRRICSLQEPLDIYHQLYENRFKIELSHLHSKQLKLGTEKADAPLRMLIPLQRMNSLPDLQTISYAYRQREFPDISSVTEPIMASGNGTMSSENSARQKRRPDLNLHSKNQLQLDTPVENLIQKHLVRVGENDLVISNNVEPGIDSSNEIDGKVGMTTDDFGQSCLRSCGTYNDQDIEPVKEYKTAIAASDSKLNPGLSNKLDNMAEKKEDIMDSLKVKETTENAQKLEIQSKQLNHDIPLFHVDTRDKAEFNYVKFVLEISGLTGKECLSAWHSSDHPVDPLLYEEMEGDPDFSSYGDSGQCNHRVLFDLINETLLELSGRPYCYCPKPLSSSVSHTHPMPKGCHALHQVWTRMSKTLCLRSKAGLTIDDHVGRDLERRDGWVNLQLFDQCVGLELKDLIFHDLLEEITCDLACKQGSY